MTANAATAPGHRSIVRVLLVVALVLGIAAPGPVYARHSALIAGQSVFVTSRGEAEKPESAVIAQISPHFVASQSIPLATPPDEPTIRTQYAKTVTREAHPTPSRRPETPTAARAPPAG
ncbi:hypothetical protein ACWEOE_29360 [Amycolatopsis sp. NPDC004368]